MPETKVKVELPDGAELELDDGATGADAAAAIGAGLAQGGAGDQGRRRAARPRARRWRAARGSRSSPTRAPRRWSWSATTPRTCWPRRCWTCGRPRRSRSGPPIADGFYYDIEFPRRASSPGPDDLARIEERMREHIAADEPFERRELPAAEAIEHFRAQGQDYKVELIEDLVRDEGAESVTAVPQRALRGPLPRPARPVDRAHRRLQADLARRRLLARRRDAADADPHLRHRLPRPEAARRPPGAARAGEAARPPQARPRAGPVHAAPRGARDALLAPQRRACCWS